MKVSTVINYMTTTPTIRRSFNILQKKRHSRMVQMMPKRPSKLCIDMLSSYHAAEEANRPTLGQKFPGYDLKHIIKTQSKFRATRQRKLYLAMLKKARYRKAVLNELISTEKLYVSFLEILNDRIRKPLVEQSVISKDESYKLFSNISEIYQLNKDFLQELEARLSNYSPYVRIGDILNTYVMFFKIYFEYLSQFNGACNLLRSLRQDNLKFKAFMAQLEGGTTLGYLDFDSILVKPIQRLPKYTLLLSDLVKHTKADHPDYSDLVKANESFLKVNEDNNSKMDKQIVNSKLFELSRLYGEPNNIKVLEANRVFIDETQLMIFSKNAGRPVTVYFMSDMLMVTDPCNSAKRVLMGCLTLNQHSMCKDLPDTANFKNLFVVIGENDSMTFIADCPESKERFNALLNQILSDLRGKTDLREKLITSKSSSKNYPIKVTILGTERKQQNLLSTCEYYIVQITIGSVSTKVHLQYSDCLSLQSNVRKKHPNTQFAQISEQSWYPTNSNKDINCRTMEIESFLQTLLSSNIIRQRPRFVLRTLGLPENFYQLPDMVKQQPEEKLSAQRKLRQLKVSEDLINSPIVPSSNRTNLQNSRQVQLFRSPLLRVDNSIEISIRVHTYHPRISLITLEMDSQSLVADAYAHLQAKLGLLSIFDFKLFDDAQLLDDDIALETLIPKSCGFFVDMFRPESQIYLKKTIYLQGLHEEMLFNEDPVRLLVTYNQLKAELKSHMYPLTLIEYGMMLSLVLIIEELPVIPMNLEILLSWLPAELIRSMKKDVWNKLVPDLHQTISQSIHDTNQDVCTLAQVMFVAALSGNPMYGISLFEVQIDKESQHMFGQYSVLLGVSVNGLTFFSMQDRHQLISYDYYQLQPLKFFGNSTYIHTSDGSTQIKLSSHSNFQIQTLVYIYIEVLLTLEENDTD